MTIQRAGRRRLLVVGGAGFVGSLLLPYLSTHHDIRVFDLRPPGDPDIDHVVGDISEYNAIFEACHDVDALIFLAMGPLDGIDTPPGWRAHLSVAVPGLYTVLRGAHDAGVTHLIYGSSLSVFHNWKSRHISDIEPEPADARRAYGLSKRLGEYVCANAAIQWNMSIVSLRMARPTRDEDWPREFPGDTVLSIGAANLGEAFLAALDYFPPEGFDSLLITGDAAGVQVDSRRTQEILNWKPRPWPPQHQSGRP